MPVWFFYVATLSFALGIALCSFVPLGLPDVLFILMMSFGVGVVAGRRSSASSARYGWLISIFLVSLALGILRMDIATWSAVESPWPTLVDTEVLVTGIIVREPDIRETSVQLYTQVDNELLLVTTDRFQSFTYGDEITVSGTLTKPAAFETDLGRTFNYPGYLEARGVSYVIRFAEVTVVSAGNGNPILATLLTFKYEFMRVLEGQLPEPQVGLAEGLLLGVKRALGTELESAFRSTGIIHIVVLSGYNVMLVVAFVTYILAFIIPFRYRVFFGVGAIIAFALMVGLSATVVRASIMACLILIAKATNRIYMVLRALLLAGTVMLILNPYLLIYDTGFQLSFMATLGLILVAPYLEERLTLMPKSIGLREFLTATLATQIFVLPILLYQIGEFSVVAVIVNVLVLPLVPLAMLLTFITGLLGFVSSALALPFAYAAYLSLTYIITIATWFASLPFASFAVPAFPFWVVIVSYAGIGYGLWRYAHRGDALLEAELADWVIEEGRSVEESVVSKTHNTPIFFR